MCHKVEFLGFFCRFLLIFVMKEVEMSQENVKKKGGLVRKFVKKHREKLSVLQEASFEKGEKQLLELLGKDPENINTFPIPGVIIGILIWAFIILFPLILMGRPSHGHHNYDLIQLLDYYVPLSGTLIIFLANQRLLVPKLFFRKRYISYIVSNSLLLGIVLVLREFAAFLQDRDPGVPLANFFSNYAFLGPSGHFEMDAIVSFLLVDAMVCGCCILIAIFTRQIIRAFIIREKKRTTLQYELDFMKSQMSPHFLFNTLNNITSLISFDPKLAETSMTKLSQLLRVMLYQARDRQIPLKDDLDVLKKYAELEKLRLDDKFDFSFETEIEKPSMMVEPMLFMPLMENAMKHCVNPKGGGFAHVLIRQHHYEIFVRVENSNFPRKAKPNSSGLGLATLKKRLELLFEGRYDYSARVEGDSYVAELRLTLKT